MLLERITLRKAQQNCRVHRPGEPLFSTVRIFSSELQWPAQPVGLSRMTTGLVSFRKTARSAKNLGFLNALCVWEKHSYLCAFDSGGQRLILNLRKWLTLRCLDLSLTSSGDVVDFAKFFAGRLVCSILASLVFREETLLILRWEFRVGSVSVLRC